jgi:hypothetical protein
MDHVLYVYNYSMHLLYAHIPSIFDINGCTILPFVYFDKPGISLPGNKYGKRIQD